MSIVELLLSATGRRSHPLFDARFYLEGRPDVAGSGANPLVHYLRQGGIEGSDPHPLFDTRFYLERHPDVARSKGNPLVHFLRRGAAERSDPHPLFDTRFYLERRPDVARSGTNPLVHFLRRGAAEGSDPHPLFDTRFYLERRPDVARSGANPLVHFLLRGAAEGSDPHPLFNIRFYVASQLGGVDLGVNPLVHFLQQGAVQRSNPHPLFSSGYYLSRNPDVARAGLNPLLHYVRFGAFEGRRPHPLFDPAHYGKQCGQTWGQEGTNPLVHYLGRKPGDTEDPHPLFDTTHYLGLCGDEVRESGNPLVHFVQEGAREGRAPSREISSKGAPSAPSELRHVPPAAKPGSSSWSVDLVAIGPTRGAADEWTAWATSSAEPARVNVAGLGLPADFPACADRINALAKGVSGGHLLLVRGSLEPRTGWVEPLLRAFEDLPRIGAACAAILADEPRPCVEAARATTGATRAVEALCPGGILIPRSVFLGLGGLDPTAPSYEEAIARLSRHLRAAGFEVYGHPHSVFVGDESSAWTPTRREGHGTLMAVVSRRGGMDASCVSNALVVDTLRLFAATGYRVLAWLPASADGGVPSAARRWESLGIDVIVGPGDRVPSAFLEHGAADAVLLAESADRATLARVMALQPAARLFLVDAGAEEAAQTTLLEHFDAVLSAGPRMRGAVHLDLAMVPPAPDASAAKDRRLYVLGSKAIVARVSPELGSGEVRVEEGVPLSARERAGALGLIALDSARAAEIEAVRSALASALPVYASPAVEATAGTWKLETSAAADGTQEFPELLHPLLVDTDYSGRLLGGTGAEARRRWPWALAERPFVKLLRRSGLPSSAAWSARLERDARDLVTLGKADADLVFLGMIPWHYRRQRPQQLSAELGRRRRRIIYVQPDFLPANDPEPYSIEESPEDNVFCVSLRAPQPTDIHRQPPTSADAAAVAANLRALLTAIGASEAVFVVHAPYWYPVCRRLAPSQLVYDCMDLYGAFPNVSAEMVTVETDLLRVADLVVFSAATLKDRLRVGNRSAVVRNGCDYSRFATAPPVRTSDRITIGYVGAIDRWFDAALVNRCVETCPEWDFVLAGSTAGLPSLALRPRPNLKLLGEVDYDDVPGLVAGWDVCFIPFADTELTRCVNPVKVYEYLAAGRPTVATRLPELRLLDPGLVRLARAAGGEFVDGLRAAVAERHDGASAARRQAWASRQTWGARADEFLTVLQA